MIGTIVNTCTIVAGTLIGVALHKGIKDKYKNVLYDALGLACFAIGLNAVVPRRKNQLRNKELIFINQL